MFEHKSVKTKVVQNVSHIYQLTNFATEVYISLLAKGLSNTMELDDAPDISGSDDH